jgi:ankyrin repeat protein
MPLSMITLLSCTDWALKEAGARISDVDTEGWNALSLAFEFGSYSLAQWLLEEGGANTTDTAIIHGEQKSVWDLLEDQLKVNIFNAGWRLDSLFKAMVLLGEAPPNFVAMLSWQPRMG